MKILIVEDEKVSRKKMKVIMSNYGVCDTCSDGNEAINRFKIGWQRNSPYDIIMLDITLDDEMDGLDVLMAIREYERKNEIVLALRAKVIIVTGHSDADHVSSSATIGTDGYIVKPYCNDSISRALRGIFLKYIEETFPA